MDRPYSVLHIVKQSVFYAMVLKYFDVLHLCMGGELCTWWWWVVMHLESHPARNLSVSSKGGVSLSTELFVCNRRHRSITRDAPISLSDTPCIHSLGALTAIDLP
jgi:hypothetical protein